MLNIINNSIIVIKNGDKYLVRRDPKWKCYLFPHNDHPSDIWSETKVNPNGISKTYCYDITMLDDCVWMTAEELLADGPTREYNGDLIQHVMELRIQ